MFEEFIKCFRPFKKGGHDADLAHGEHEFETPALEFYSNTEQSVNISELTQLW